MSRIEKLNEKKVRKRQSRFPFFVLIIIAVTFLGGTKLDNYLQERTEQKLLAEKKQEEIERKEIKQREAENKEAFIQKMLEKEKALVEQGTDDIEPNSKEMMGYILAKASQDAQNIISDDEEFNKAFHFIRDNYPNYFENNDMMEKTMYYSKVVQYTYDPRWENYKSLSTDFEEAYSVWDDTYLKTERPPKSLMTLELTKFNIAEQAGAAARRVYLNMETVDSGIIQGMLAQTGMQLNSLYPDKTFWEAPKIPDAQTNVSTQPKEMMVWIPTNGGIKYHIDASCSDMINPAYVTESEAISRGFGMCKKCF